MIKKTLKFTLSALLLSAAGWAFAEEGPVTLSDGSKVSWEDFANVINSGKAPAAGVSDAAVNEAKAKYDKALEDQTSAASPVKTKQDSINALTKQLAVENDSLTVLEKFRDGIMPQTVTKNLKYSDEPWYKTQRNAFNTFKGIYDTEADGGAVWYYLPSSGRSKTLYLSFVNPGSAQPVTGASYVEVTANKFYDAVIEPTTTETAFTSVKVFLGYKTDDNGQPTEEYNYTVGTNGLYSVPNYSSTTAKEDLLNIVESGFITLGEQSTGATESVPTEAYTNANNAVQKQQAVVNNLKKQITLKQNELESLQEALDTANETVETTKAAYDKAVEDYDAAVAAAASDALKNYQDVTLTGNIDADTPITASDYKGTIDGNNFVINVASGNLFRKFSGQLSNAAVNGTFAGSYVGATFDNVAVNTGAAFRYYDGGGNQYSGTIESLGQLGFLARESFGVDFAAEKLAKKSAATIVYDITVYEPDNKTTQYYVTKNGTTLTGETGSDVEIPVNMFAKSATSDLKDINNVYYVKGGSNVCDNALIVDKVDFYCPENITATNLTYERSFNDGINTVCLPFTLSKTGNISALCTYDRETKEKFWFTYVSGSVSANKPALLVANGGFENLNLSGVAIAKTDNQVVGPEGTDKDNSRSYGTLKAVNSGEFLGEFMSSTIFGLHDGKFEQAITGASFPAFRMVISSINAPAEKSAPRRIAIADEYGVDITDMIIDDDYEVNGVEDIVSDASEFGISGGQGEIVITSDVDYGKVVVYTVDGKAVAAANVVAGTTAVNVEKGLYIVMGKKVMVK